MNELNKNENSAEETRQEAIKCQYIFITSSCALWILENLGSKPLEKALEELKQDVRSRIDFIVKMVQKDEKK